MVPTRGRGIYEITSQVDAFAAGSGIVAGLCHLFLQHTSASLMICENADPTVLRDVETFFARLVPDGDPSFAHDTEGPDDMPAHIRSVLTQSDLTIPISSGHLALGTWQGVFVYEHRLTGHRRHVLLTAVG
ncbi:MAG TPA: secondary thiamine-phosphate synthase enzyme YjbQ [Gammaproteobacteria bacterium]|nr:secondary thiamine-phosphate synthase enzyme YjbQ [Gammaproteobacteria bacterium]